MLNQIFMKNFTLISLIFVFCCLSLAAQHTVTGTIISAEDALPLIGVNVTAKSKEAGTLGTITDFDGKYQLKIQNPQDTLVFSYIGCVTQEIPAEGKNVIDVILRNDSEQLEEVVVTALGIKRQKREVGYSTESFTGDKIAMSNAPNIVNSLSGKSAGVQIAAPDGVDGGTSRIVIRGNNNISANNQPLIVVDGMPLENEPGLTNIGRGVDWGSAINNINAQDIESVDILKGPTASALYGSRGANGVVLITTKRGKKGKGLGVNYSIIHKITQPYYYRDVQNTYGAGGPISLLEPTLPTDGDGTYLYPSTVHVDDGPLGKPTTESFGFYSTGMSWGPKMEGQNVRWWDGEMRSFTPQPDNLKQYFKNGNTTTHNLSFSGGNDLGSIRLSMTRTQHDAIIPNSNYNQTTINLGSRLDISKRIKMDLAVSYTDYYRLNSPTLGDDNERSFGKGILYSWPRSYKGLEEEINFLPDGTRNDYSDIEGGYPFTYTAPHLWWNTYNNNTHFDRGKLLGALTMTYEITDWLNVRGRLGLDFTLDQFEERRNPTDALGIENGFYGNSLTRDFVHNNEVLLTLHKDKIFDSPFDASISFGGTQWQRDGYGISAKNQNNEWVNPRLYTFNNYEGELNAPELSEFRFNKKINSIYSFLNLSYANFAFLELTGRNDWSSSLPIDNNDYFYPSASLSFLPTVAFSSTFPSWLSFWKVRGAYAQTASDDLPFLVDFIYETADFGGSQTATLPTTIPPIALKPQKANSYEIGTTVGLWDDKINLDLTYYYINSFDQILNSPLPASSGANEIKINTGKLENKGIEAILNVVLMKKPNFFWETGFNFARNRNVVVSLGDGAKRLELSNIWGLNGPAIVVEEGQEYGTIVGYDYVYHEETGKPILNDEGTHYLLTEDQVPIGNASPDFIGGWTMRLGWKGLKVSTLVDTKWGGDIYAGSYVIGLQTGQSPETLEERNGGGLPYVDSEGNERNVGVILEGVYADGTVNDKVVHHYFKYIGNTGGWGRFLSTPGIQENSWVKLREIALSYELKSNLLAKTKVFQDLTLSLVGRDLFYLYTSLPDRVNPEGISGSGNAQGLEWAAFPGTRSVSIGLNASF